MRTIPAPSSTELIPPPQELRLRLAAALRDVDLLRRLLRLAERAARFTDRRTQEATPEGGKHASQ